MRRRYQIVAAGILIILLGVVVIFRFGLVSRPASAHGIAATPGAHAATTVSCTTSPWGIVTTPSVNGGVLRAIAADSSSDMWAVGYYYNSTVQANRTLIERWNGAVWSIIPSPNTGNGANQLYGVAAISSHDAWAVGFYSDLNGATLILTEHWNGAQWSIVPTPNPAGQAAYGVLVAISATSSSDVWAAGFLLDINARNDRTITEHWDGTQWSIIPSANPGTYSDDLLGVAAVSTNDVWAVGYYQDSTFIGALMEHWDGASWTAISNPPVGVLYGVAAVSSNDVWAVGGGLTVHWDGTKWSVVPIPPGVASVTLRAVTAISANDVWAVGDALNGTVPPLSEHWNGSSWSTVPLADPMLNSQFFGVIALSSSNVRAVGNSGTNTVAEHYRTLFQGGPTSHATPRGPSHHPGGAILCP
jgi:hypothetical protein